MSTAIEQLLELTKEPKIAYFSMEIGVHNDIPTYSGGLGVLAGDTIRSGADLKLPMVAVTLLCRKGYFRQDINENGRQVEYPYEWDPARYMQLIPCTATVLIEGRKCKCRHGSIM
jgi:starch phosphorylase